jgi:hypothetical protein
LIVLKPLSSAAGATQVIVRLPVNKRFSLIGNKPPLASVTPEFDPRKPDFALLGDLYILLRYMLVDTGREGNEVGPGY